MGTFAEYIDKVLAEDDEYGGDPIESIIIGAFGWGDWDQIPGTDNDPYASDISHLAASQRRGEILTWDKARPLLDYEYNGDYGAPDCHAITAWSASRVYWITEYDGSTRLSSAPRNPYEGHRPSMPGG